MALDPKRRALLTILGLGSVILAAGWLAIETGSPEGLKWAAFVATLLGGGLLAIPALQGDSRADAPEPEEAGYRLLAERLQEDNRELSTKVQRVTLARDESEHYIETLMDNVPANIYFKDRESRFVRVNRSQAKWLGCSHAADLVGKSDHDFFAPEHADQALADERKILETGQPIVGYVEGETLPTGEEAWVLTTKMPFRDRKGKIIGTFGISNDVSELVRAQQTLERERNILRALIDSFPDHIHVKDAEGRFMVVNRAFAGFLGQADSNVVLGHTDDDFFMGEVADEIRKEDELILRTGEAMMNREGLQQTLDGEERIVVTTKVPLPDEAGQPYAIVAMVRDVTEQRRAQEALFRSERQLEDIINNAPSVIYLKGVDGRYLLVNRRYETLFHVSREEVYGKSDHDIFDPRTADAFRDNDELVVEEGDAIQVEEIAPQPDGDHTYLSVKFPLRDSIGEIYAIGGVSTDITERKRHEEDLRNLNQELIAANENLRAAQEELIQAEKMESVGRLAAGVAHEVKNPLAMIAMGLEIVSRRAAKDDEKLAETVERMRRGVERAKDIIKGLVDFSVARQLRLEERDVNEVVEETLALARYQISSAGVQIVRELGRDLPPAPIDGTKVEQVLLNLCINAVHAMEEGGILTIRTRSGILRGVERQEGARVHGTLRDGIRYIAIDVEDTGRGIDDEKMDKIFDPFYTTKSTGMGSGLGLSVVRKIMDLHHGMIEIVNKSEGGVRATLTFQVARE